MGVGLAAICGWLLGSSLACVSCRRADAKHLQPVCSPARAYLQGVLSGGGEEWVGGEVELAGFAGSDVVPRIGVEGSRVYKRIVSGGKGN